MEGTGNPEAVLGIEASLALLLAVPAFVAWALTEFVNDRWIAPWKRARARAGRPAPGWAWTSLLGSICVGLSGGVGLSLTLTWPVVQAPPLVGFLVGLAGGAQPVWILKVLAWFERRRGGEPRDRLDPDRE